jgi:hypothetical protein
VSSRPMSTICRAVMIKVRYMHCTARYAFGLRTSYAFCFFHPSYAVYMEDGCHRESQGSDMISNPCNPLKAVAPY